MGILVKKCGEGPNVVLLHGYGFCHKIWDSLSKRQKYTYYLVDLPGFGESDNLIFNDFKHELLSALPNQFALVGWSLGGLYATRLALEEPHRVSKLLVVTSTPKFLSQSAWPGFSEKALASFNDKLYSDFPKTIKDFIKLQVRNKIITYEPKLYVPGIKSGLEALKTWDLREELNNLIVPTCYVFGKLDAIVPVAVQKVMQSTWPKIHYEIFPRAAHMPFLSDEAKFFALMDEFLC